MKIAIASQCSFSLTPIQWEIYLSKKGKKAYFVEVDYLQENGPVFHFRSKEELKTCDYGWKVFDSPEGYLNDEPDLSSKIAFIKDYRTDPDLISTIEETNSQYGMDLPTIKIIEIPDDVKWEINTSEYGRESIHEVHRVWE